jgi:hypothetical protein
VRAISVFDHTLSDHNVLGPGVYGDSRTIVSHNLSGAAKCSGNDHSKRPHFRRTDQRHADRITVWYYFFSTLDHRSQLGNADAECFRLGRPGGLSA